MIFISILVLLIAALLVFLGRKVYIHSFLPRFQDSSYPTFQTEIGNQFLYPVNLIPSIKESVIDENGEIIYTGYPNFSPTFHPTLTCIYCIVLYEKYLTDNTEKVLTDFNNNFATTQKHLLFDAANKKTFLAFDFDFYGEKAPWTSGITQAFLIAALIRKYLIDNNSAHIERAEQVYNFINAPLENNSGCRFSSPAMPLWVEEDSHGFHILNGHIYGLFAVYELYRITKKEIYKTQFDLGISSIKQNIQQFDLGFYTRYDLSPGSVCNNAYHKMHIELFKALHHLTNDDFFNHYSKKFENYQYQSVYKARLFLYLFAKTTLAKVGVVI